LLTGRYPGNAGVRSILRGHRTATGLPREVPTIATALRAIGYHAAKVLRPGTSSMVSTSFRCWRTVCGVRASADERNNLRDREPEITSAMRTAAEAWHARIESAGSGSGAAERR
jgi:hypothetical protein